MKHQDMAGTGRLPPRQARFAAEYVVDLNATAAAIRAGYSAKTAQQQGSRLLSNVMVAAAVRVAKAERAHRTEVTADHVVRELACIGFGDIRRLFDETGRLRAVSDLPDDVAAFLASVEVLRERTTIAGEATTEESTVKVKAWDKLRALELLGKHLGIFKDQFVLSPAPIYALPEGCWPSMSRSVPHER